MSCVVFETMLFSFQFGFMDMNIDDNMGVDDEDRGDEDLEAELAALTSDSSASKPKKGNYQSSVLSQYCIKYLPSFQNI